jgi:hypothetical protein
MSFAIQSDLILTFLNRRFKMTKKWLYLFDEVEQAEEYVGN